MALLVDALDECGESEALRIVQMFGRITADSSSCSHPVEVCFSCRHYPIVDLISGLHICMEEENGDDIVTCVTKKLGPFNMAESLISHDLLEKAEGVFQWVVLVVEMVINLKRQRGFSDPEIQERIRFVPGNLQALYYELLSDIEDEDKPFSFKLFIWVAFADRYLTPSELVRAITIDPNIAPRYAMGLRMKTLEDPREFKTRLRVLSCGLTEVRSVKGVERVQFIHNSVLDYFLREQGLSVFHESWNSPKLVEAYAHDFLYRACIKYITSFPKGELCEAANLICREGANGNKTNGLEDIYEKDSDPEWTLLCYAFEMWDTHAINLEAAGLDFVKPCEVLDYFQWPDYTYINQ